MASAVSSPTADDVAVVLVDHGSKRAEANEMLEEFATLNLSSRQRVEIAHMELAEPSIGTAVSRCASEGFRKIVIAPYFLSRGRHITSDIPALVAEAQKAHPEVECVIAEPIGIDPLMAQVIENRVAGALQSA
ncbi:CbiX-domain-containing protein [Coccomyxa subellipsoidea C-169]|uniref:CbiX-domain-containing protein n=1 Tax=Coccomyxa subellipsoidea (strain C-169) TaxID=574566 RepID=I0YLC8_COCSC|nr:CbiX-domain-containing protein [Coccomyxa subellipsoidea C-169]EIE19197.1 CbiX-domain-containing protein [Coccomyxa subellipsoidea C-169]|eukprot:XP_005643741.1 CbiX-domain-containing protein [Coccomyxa subellipsoidea C-169]